MFHRHDHNGYNENDEGIANCDGGSNETTVQSTVKSTKLLGSHPPHKSATNPNIATDLDAIEALEAGAGLKTNWYSILLACVMGLISATQFTLYFTSLWSFMKVLDHTTTEFFFGAVIAVYSLAQIIASPILGYWSNRIHQLRYPLIVCSGFMIAGNLLYSLVELFPSHHNYWLLLARFITGIGASNLGLLKAYASVASTIRDRRKAMAFITGGNALGLTVGPGLQFFFTAIGYPGWSVTPSFNISMFTAPALFACVLNVGSVVVLLFFFQESFVGVLDVKAKRSSNRRRRSNSVGVQRTQGNSSSTPAPVLVPAELPNYDYIAAGVCYAIRFTQMFVFTNIETIGSSFEMMMFAFTATEVVKYSSYAHMARGIVTLAVYVVFIFTKLGSVINDRLVSVVSLVGLFLYHAFTFPWWFFTVHVRTFNNTFLESNPDQAVGCNTDLNSWCYSLTQVNVWDYYVLMTLLVGLSFSNINVTMNTIFSRVIGPRMQGTQQGILQMCEGSARMFGPLIVGFIYARNGPRPVWILESVVIAVMTVIWIMAYRRLVPLKIHPIQQHGSGELTTVPSKQIMSPLELCGMSRMNQHIFDEPDGGGDGARNRLRSASTPADHICGRREKRIFTIGS